MRILYVTPFGFNDRLRYFTEFVLGRSFARMGWEVSACVLRDGPEERPGRFEVDGIRGVRVHGMSEAWWQLPRLIRRADLVHVFHLRNPLGLPALLMARLFQRPLVFSEYGLLHDAHLVADRDDPLASPPLASKWMRARLSHLPMTAADVVVFLSRHNVEVARRAGLCLRRVECFAPLVDGRRFEGQQQGILRDEPETVSGSFGLYVGQMKLRKGWDVLLRALPGVPRSAVERFVFVSPTSVEPPKEFRQQVERLELTGRVSYLGRVSNATLDRLYRDCSLVVIPSRYEGFGLAALEAFEAAKPLIASNVPALNEFVVDELNGLLVPRGDPGALAAAIVRLRADPRLAQALVERGRKSLAEYSVERALDRWRALYEDVSARTERNE